MQANLSLKKKTRRAALSFLLTGVQSLLKMLSGRKGQFYILIALLLISYAFMLSRQDTPIRRPEDSFKRLHEGYINEGLVVVNNAVYEDANVSARLESFTDSYMAFARSTEPGFRLVYLLKEGNSLALGNRMDSEINFTVGNASYVVSSGSGRVVPASDASFAISGVPYDFKFSPDALQLKALFRAAGKLETRVYVKG